MSEYSKTGTIFFNEVHFQAKFVICLSKELSMDEYEIFLEYNPNYKKYRVDMMVRNTINDDKILFEFKYITKKDCLEILFFFINLKDQGAYDVHGYQI